MALQPRLDIYQAQSLIMTPKLQEAIKLLQLSNLELSDYLEKELEKNPFLEHEDPDENNDLSKSLKDNYDHKTSSEIVDSNLGTKEQYLNTTNLIGALDKKEHSISNSVTEEKYLGETITSQSQSTKQFGNSNTNSLYPGIENREKISLKNHLLEQINVDFPNSVERLIAIYILDLLDDSGYLQTSAEMIAETLGCPISRVNQTLDTLQNFDPPGIFARNLSECLALQLKEHNRYDSIMEKLLENLDLLAKRKFKSLKRLCGIDDKNLINMIREIRALNPKPAQIFDNDVAPPLTPDVFVNRSKDGSWFVELNTETLPKVIVNNRYYAEINQESLNSKDKAYLSEYYQSANWLIKSMHQRAQTIIRVTSEIIRQQSDFLEKGVQFLKPLVLQEIADALNIHESTVSRVTRNKVLATPRGIFSLKYFFTMAIGKTNYGNVQSSESVRFQIKNLIEKETIDNILSDEKIVKLLKIDGIDVARRTVAKYRNIMNIPSSTIRKREKNTQFIS